MELRQKNRHFSDRGKKHPKQANFTSERSERLLQRPQGASSQARLQEKVKL